MKWWDKIRLHWRRLHIKNWMLMFALVFGVSSSIFLLRQNNLEMVRLRNNVIEADKNGIGVTEALKSLNTHVFHHMNTEIVRPIELVQTYNRQAQKVIEEASKGSGRDVYAEAAAACERRGIPLTSVAQCAAEYAAKNNSGAGAKEIKLPDKNRFVYSFAAPLWTPDLAGISILVTGVIGIWLLIRLVEFLLVRLVMRHHAKRGF